MNKDLEQTAITPVAPTPNYSPQGDSLVSQIDKAPRKWADLNFKVNPEFKHLYDLEAKHRRMSNIKLMKTALRFFLDVHGSIADPGRKIL